MRDCLPASSPGHAYCQPLPPPLPEATSAPHCPAGPTHPACCPHCRQLPLLPEATCRCRPPRRQPQPPLRLGPDPAPRTSSAAAGCCSTKRSACAPGWGGQVSTDQQAGKQAGGLRDKRSTQGTTQHAQCLKGWRPTCACHQRQPLLWPRWREWPAARTPAPPAAPGSGWCGPGGGRAHAAGGWNPPHRRRHRRRPAAHRPGRLQTAVQQRWRGAKQARTQTEISQPAALPKRSPTGALGSAAVASPAAGCRCRPAQPSTNSNHLTSRAARVRSSRTSESASGLLP